ncbi:MAG: glycosyltransferase family 2 protein [Clostridia bacterium]|nr:glycosyltransferase family 2 protein [Clostridia bacterium]
MQELLNKDVLLTVATPSYNRAHTLPEVYASLCAQTDKRFLWMIIDDGSTDRTEELVNGWVKEGKLQIAYHKKPNGGKASALNVGIGLLETRYAVCLDSDDTFYPRAVEIALEQLDSIRDDDAYCGLLALRNNPDGRVMGGRPIPEGTEKVTAVDIFLRWNLKTELICFYKTALLKQYRFPEFPGEKFVSPAWMQYEITRDRAYKPSWDQLCCCEYIADGLTKNKRKVIMRNPRGYTCIKRFSFDLAPNLKQLIKNGIMYDCGCLLGKDKDWLKNAKHKGWAIVLMPAAWLVRMRRFNSKS